MQNPKSNLQSLLKERDDLEAQFHEINKAAERASLQQSTLQQDIERKRQQANDALKAMDAERQKLRSANNKLRDNIEELRRSFESKENALEALQQSLLEKEQVLEDMKGLLQSAEEKTQASIVELSAKHQKVLIAEKESRIAEMDAASSGEAAWLRAALDSGKAELAHQKQEHEKEKESWESASRALKMKLEIVESNCIRAETEAAKMRTGIKSVCTKPDAKQKGW